MEVMSTYFSTYSLINTSYDRIFILTYSCANKPRRFHKNTPLILQPQGLTYHKHSNAVERMNDPAKG